MLMVSGSVCGKGHLYFVYEKAKIIAAYYLKKLLPKLVEYCEQLQYRMVSSSSKTALRLTRHASQRTGLKSNCSDFIAEDKCSPIHPISVH